MHKYINESVNQSVSQRVSQAIYLFIDVRERQKEKNAMPFDTNSSNVMELWTVGGSRFSDPAHLQLGTSPHVSIIARNR